jgi:hypothetical protein
LDVAPRTEEMVDNGLDVAQMDAKLLQKIEELTLYLIEINKKAQYFNSQNLLLNKKIAELTIQIKEIKGN